MTNEELKDLKARLWKTADQLRSGSGLKPTKYSPPILGVIFLRFANSKYANAEERIATEYHRRLGTRAELSIDKIAIGICGFYLPECAKYDVILNTSVQEDLAGGIKKAMEEIEKYNPTLEGVLPKDVYYDIASSEDPQLLKKVVRNFKDIPDDIGIDIFGEIYEYFLGEFVLAEGQGGGTFFTPESVVRYMVEVLAPTEGKILDPACGSTGFIVLRARILPPDFVYFLARSQYFRGIAIGSMNGADGCQRASVSKIKQIKLICPTQDLLNKFSEVSKPFSDAIFKLSSMNHRLVKQRNRLLPHLLSGNLEIKI